MLHILTYTEKLHPLVSCGSLWPPGASCGILWHPVASCGVLWRPVASCGSHFKVLLQSKLWASSGVLEHPHGSMASLGLTNICLMRVPFYSKL